MTTICRALLLLGIFLHFESALSAPVLNPYYGKTSQLDPELHSYKLTKGDDSLLCVPTVMVNILEKLRNDYGTETPFSSGAYEIADIVTRIAPLAGISSAEFVARGIQIPKIKILMDYKIKKERLPLETRMSYSSQLDIDALRRSVLAGYGSLVVLFYYKDQGEGIDNLQTPYAGHALAVIGYDDEDSEKFYFSDPYRPLQVRGARLVAHPLKSQKGVHYQAVFDDGAESVIYMINSALLISPKVL